MSKIPSYLLETKQTLAVCPITGISITIGIPKISIPLIYQNPLADSRNIKAFAELPFQELAKLSPVLLSGGILSLLSSKKLISDHLSGVERNTVLSEAPIPFLISSLKFLSSFSFLKGKEYPSFSFESFLAQEKIKGVGIRQGLHSFLIDLKRINDPKEQEESEETRTFVSSIKGKKNNERIPEVKKETRDIIRNAILVLKREDLISQKFYTALAVLLHKDTLLHVSQENRSKMISKLEALAHPEASKIITILKATNSVSFNKMMDDSLSNASDAIPWKKPSLQEILDKKLGRIPKDEPTEEISAERLVGSTQEISIPTPTSIKEDSATSPTLAEDFIEQKEKESSSLSDSQLQILGELSEIIEEDGYELVFAEDEEEEITDSRDSQDSQESEWD